METEPLLTSRLWRLLVALSSLPCKLVEYWPRWSGLRHVLGLKSEGSLSLDFLADLSLLRYLRLQK